MSKKNDSGSGVITILFALVFATIGGCRGFLVSDTSARKALDTAGFTELKQTGSARVLVALRGCGSDAARFDYEATNPVGKRVNVSVCVGWPFKGATIRSE